MKKLILFTMALVALTNWSEAQNTTMGPVYIGPVGGVGSSGVRYAPGTRASIFSGYAGIGIVDKLDTHWGLGGQLVLSAEGYKANYPNSQVPDVPAYLRMPLRAYYFFGNRSNTVRPELYFGPLFAVKVGEHTSASNYVGDIYYAQNASNFRTFDAGFDGGGGIEIKLARNVLLNLDLGFYQGLTDALKDPSGTYNPNQDVDLNVGVLFGIR